MAFAAPLVPLLGGFFGSASGILATASAGIGAATAISQGNYQAAVARNNAQIAEENAVRQSEASQKEAMRLSQENAGRVGELAASQGASGLSADSASFRAGRALETRIGRREVLDVAQQGNERSQASRQQAANFRSSASSSRINGLLGAAGSALSLGNSFMSSPQGKSLVGPSKLKKRFG